VTVSVTDSEGKPVEGVSFIGKPEGGYDVHWGATNADGKLELSLAPGRYTIHGNYRNTTETKQFTIAPEDAAFSVPFQTVEARVKIEDTEGRSLSGATVTYQGAYSNFLGRNSDENGIISAQLFPGVYPMTASYRLTKSATQSVDIRGGGVDATFTATALRLNFPGEITYVASGYSSFYVKPVTSLFPGTYPFTFKANGKTIVKDITVGSQSLNLNYICVSLESSGGVGLAGGVVSYWIGSWKNNAAITDDSGLALIPIPSGTVTTVAMNYRGTENRIDQRMDVNPIYAFQTKSVRVSLLSSQDVPLAGGAKYYAGGAWRDFGEGGAANSSMEMLPGRYPFSVTYAGAIQQKDSVDIAATPDVVFRTARVEFRLLDSRGNPLPGGAQYYAGVWRDFGDQNPGAANNFMEMLPVRYPFTAFFNGARQQLDGWDVALNPVVTFQTGSVTLRYTGTVRYYTSTWNLYGGPIELLPVKTLFKFEPNKSGFAVQEMYITPVAGAAYEKTVAYVRLAGSGGVGIAGGEIKYYDGIWANLGTTGENGLYFGLLEGNKAKNLSFGMTLGGGYFQKSQNLASDSHVEFGTLTVEFRLVDSNGNPLEGGAQYYAGGWKPFGNGATNCFMEMLPASYSFGVAYLGGYIQKTQDVRQNPVVEFRTVPVSVKILSSTGEELEGDATYYANGWKPFADGKTSRVMEMLPTRYSFGVTYLGGYNQKEQDVSADPNVVFRTVPVSLRLDSSLRRPLEGEASYYAGGWKPFGDGTTNCSMEMLPAKYTFAVKYLGATVQKEQTVSGNCTVSFKTKLVTVCMYVPITFCGKEIGNLPVVVPSRGEASFYAGKWTGMNSQSIVPAVRELLPTTYSFAVTYGGQRQQKAQDVGKDPVVWFATTQDAALKAIKALG